MEELINCFDFEKREIVSIIGSGGKTSLLWYLAENYSNEKVLVGTTTNIGFPQDRKYNTLATDGFESIKNVDDGVTVIGERVPGKPKLRQPEGNIFPAVFPLFDKVFLECDGSKQLPLKGWADFEPVVLDETTITIGVIPMSVIGKTVDEETIHRLPLFLEMTGCNTGDEITVEALYQVITQKSGLWRESTGLNILLLNQVDTDQNMTHAKRLAEMLLQTNESIERVVASNLHENKGTVLWKK